MMYTTYSAEQLTAAIRMLIDNCHEVMDCEKCAVKDWCHNSLGIENSPGSWREPKGVERCQKK